MGRLTAALVIIAGLLLGAGSCDYVSNINSQANQAYHASRWQATIQSCVKGEAYQAPAEPIAPRVCSEIDSVYPEVANSFNAASEEWDELVYQAEVDIAFSAEMLGVLDSRNTYSIEKLAPQITGYVEQTEACETTWRGKLDQTNQALTQLTNRWEAVWPGNELQFDLEAQVIAQRLLTANNVGELREEALSHYHQNEFSRMAETYLGFEIVGYTVPEKSHLPQDCTAVADAHQALDAALLVRYGLDKAIEQDLELIARLARVDMSNQAWEDIKVPKGRYGEKRVQAAIARLKLLKYLDTLATDSLGIIIRQVGLAWEETWPGHSLETNIFAYAGVPKVE